MNHDNNHQRLESDALRRALEQIPPPPRHELIWGMTPWMFWTLVAVCLLFVLGPVIAALLRDLGGTSAIHGPQ